MRRRLFPPFLSYLIAIAVVAIAVALRALLDPWLGDRLPAATLFAAIAVAVWLGGWRPALLTMVLGYLLCDYFFMAPRGTLKMQDHDALVVLLTYVLSAAILIGFAEALRVAQRQVSRRKELLQVTLASIGDAVIATDTEGRIDFMNGVAETLTGWTQKEAIGAPLSSVLRILNEATGQRVADPTIAALSKGIVVGLANHTILIAKDGQERPIDDSAAPIRNREGQIIGCVLVFRDITERRKVEQALERSEDDLRDFFENATIGLHWVGPDGTILRANKAELELLGYREEEYVGRHIREFHADGEVITDILRRLSAGEALYNYPARLRCKDGSIKNVLINSNVRRENGRFIHTRCFTRDVTLLHRAEEAQARLAAIVTSSDDAIVSKSLEGIILTWNAGAEHIFGYPAAEAVGQSINLIIPPERRDEERGILERLRRGERIEHLETVRVTKDGRRLDISLTVSPVRNAEGQIVGASKVARDITARKAAEHQLNADLRAMSRLHELGNLCALKDSDFRHCLLHIVDIAIALTGADKGNMQLFDEADGALRLAAHRGFAPPFLNFFAVVGADEAAACGAAIRNGERVVVEDVTRSEIFAGQPSREVLLEAGVQAVQSTPLLSSSGNLLGMISTHFAQAGRPQERALGWMDLLARQAADFLERRRADDELQRLNNELREADQRKDEFLALLAHELRNPLAPLRAGVEIARRMSPPDSRIQETVDIMDRQLAHLVRLVDDLLDVNRISSGKIELKPEPVPLSRVISLSLESSRDFIEAQGHRLTLDVADDLTVNADIHRLTQVLVNLLSNSAKYTDRGGQIRLSLHREGDEAILRVEDNGIGIAPEDLERVFDMFGQLEPGKGRSQRGLGIGLYLARSLVTMHGGTLSASSGGLGAGSTFTIRLPAASQQLKSKPASDVAKPNGQSVPKLRILIADDHRDGADSLALLLSMRGHDVATAKDGLEAVEQAQRWRPDAIFLDLGMPGLDGIEAAKRILSLPGQERTFIAAVTGWGDERARDETKAAGIDAHLVKPVMLEAVDEVLGPVSRS